jgi:hypothetical protein
MYVHCPGHNSSAKQALIVHTQQMKALVKDNGLKLKRNFKLFLGGRNFVTVTSR